ncbi:hypothetical protein H6B33_01270 [Gemmiger formicilis]|uniref:DUF6291 domain-containing protein n=1 Tax=Gemmiger formicilis TaxID=745368 RepID=UPI001959E913|nr:DUF6291 domain-containing protein [Gemmiger formicilis]MBM6914034.1 hypothetical protein [Gemmiger formicilis]
MAREYFCAYHSYLAAMEPLNDAERGRLFTALLIYSQTGDAPHLDGNERFVFPVMREQIDRESKKYAAKCERNRENVMKRYSNEYERNQSYSNATNTKTKKKTKTRTKTKENIEGVPGGTPADKPPKTRAFVPPSVEEVRAYCLERGNNIDPQYFVDYYEARGWMIGKNKMKDWRAAMRTWEQRNSGSQQKGEEDIGKYSSVVL